MFDAHVKVWQGKMCSRCLQEAVRPINPAYSGGLCQSHRYKGAARNYDQERRHVETTVNAMIASAGIPVRDSARSFIVQRATQAYFMGKPDALVDSKSKRQANGAIYHASIPQDRCDKDESAMVAVIDAELRLLAALHVPDMVIARNVVVIGKNGQEAHKDIMPNDRIYLGDEVTVAQDEYIRSIGLRIAFSERKGQFYVSIPRQYDRQEIKRNLKRFLDNGE